MLGKAHDSPSNSWRPTLDSPERCEKLFRESLRLDLELALSKAPQRSAEMTGMQEGVTDLMCDGESLLLARQRTVECDPDAAGRPLHRAIRTRWQLISIYRSEQKAR